jgi:hypothetical protein
MRRSTLLILGAAAIGCAKVPHLRVEVPGVNDAQVTLRSTGEPSSCVAPCTVQLTSGQPSGELEIRAPGYFPARMQVEASMLQSVAGVQGTSEEAVLRVPLEPRPGPPKQRPGPGVEGATDATPPE